MQTYKKQVGWIELCFFFASFLFLLVIVVYAWVLYESCSLEVTRAPTQLINSG